MNIFHDQQCATYARPGHPERPGRVTRSVPVLRERHPSWRWPEVRPAADDVLQRAHSRDHVENIRRGEEDFDADTPAYRDVYAHAARAAGAALQVGRLAWEGSPAFALMRPPGHHATRDRAMGFCYFSNIAVAALDLVATGVSHVAIWDFDAHHGNGTEAIVANHPQIAFASVHQFPGYPGTGNTSFANLHNFPVAPFAKRDHHMVEIRRALELLISKKPAVILVSAGFDAYRDDPITQMSLEPEDFATCGRWLRECGVKAGAILEGGYSDELPDLIDAFVSAWAGE